MYTPSVIAIGFYFEKWRALAMAISCCGSSLGVMLFPVLMEEILPHLPWRTKFRIIGGMLGICGISGLVYKPIKATKVEKIVQFGEVSQIHSSYTVNNEVEVKGGTGISAMIQRFRNILFPTISEVSASQTDANSRQTSSTSTDINFYLNKEEDDDDMKSSYIPPSSQEILRMEGSLNTPSTINRIAPIKIPVKSVCYERCNKCLVFSHCCHCCLKPHQISLTHINRPLYRDDIFYCGSIFRLSQISTPTVPVNKGLPSLAYTVSVSRAATQKDLAQQTQCVCCPEAYLRVFATMLNIQMLKSPSFVVLLISGYLSLMTTYIVFAYISISAVQVGISQDFSKMLFSIIGVSNTIGRAVCGCISCYPSLDMNMISWITICIAGISIFFAAFSTSEVQFAVICVIYGFTLASFAVLRALVFVDMFGLENLTNCFGLNMIFQSVAAFTGTPLANFILKMTSNNFMVVFIFVGSVLVVSGVLLIPLKFILKWEQNRKRRVTFNDFKN
ncbi:hypothetical protein ABEB36_012329 [Hypothenemus hampei]|uniref:Uncharacterized protein n=1 Tax=Hypothenemus hampei TaxID=57062 RepID=A0ABD1EAU0_HYPHA